MSPRARIRLLAALIVLGALAGVGLAWRQRLALRPLSDPITARWDAVGDLWLLPNLDDARVIVPNRPARPQEPLMPLKAGEPYLQRTRSFTLRTNAERLRGPPVGAKDPARPRILVVGDSVASGWGVAEDETLPAKLAVVLAESGHPVEVLNAGVPAAGTSAMAAYCAVAASRLQPDLVLWSRRPNAGGANEVAYVQDLLRCQRAVQVPVLAVLHPLSTFDPQAQRARVGEVSRLRHALDRARVPLFDPTDVVLAAQQGRGEILVDEGAQYVVLDQESGEERLRVAATDRGLPDAVYDLFEQDDAVEEALFFDGAHPNGEGFGVVARWLGPQLLRYLPGSAGG